MNKNKVPVKTIYYKDEQNEEFSGIRRETKCIDETYKYSSKNLIWRIAATILYYVLAIPVAYLYGKLKFSLKIRNKKVLRPYRKQGYFLFGNHTQVPGDGFFQALVSFPKKNYVIVNADNVSLKGTEQMMLMVGAMPLPTTMKGYKNFLHTLDERCRMGSSIVIYPEAHIWPYYTGIRPFPQTAFSYPIREDKPIFTFTVVYKERKYRRTPRVEIMVDGPFFTEDRLSTKKAEKVLRDVAYNQMVKRASESNCKYYDYIKERNVDG